MVYIHFFYFQLDRYGILKSVLSLPNKTDYDDRKIEQNFGQLLGTCCIIRIKKDTYFRVMNHYHGFYLIS